MKSLAILFIRFYQALHGSFFFGTCRFHPTCSQYAVEAIETRGIFTGIGLTAYRLVRCQPFCKGGWDPVPAPAESWDAGVFPDTGTCPVTVPSDPTTGNFRSRH